jgi:XamI restriction endonuclease
MTAPLFGPSVTATSRVFGYLPATRRDRLIGLAYASKNLVSVMEEKKAIPRRMPAATLEENLTRIADVITRMLDIDIFPWITSKQHPTEEERYRASTIVADRLCGAVSDPIIRNAQEKRQLDMIAEYLQARGYRQRPHPANKPLNQMAADGIDWIWEHRISDLDQLGI